MGNNKDEYVIVDDAGQQAPLGSNLPYFNQKSDRADLLEKIKPDLIVEVIRQRLMGYEYKDGAYVKSQDKFIIARSISERGAWDITTLILSVANQNTAISKLSDRVINARALGIVRTVRSEILANWKEYNIRGVDQIDYILCITFSLVLIILKQPEDEGLRKLLSGIISENRAVSEGGNQSGLASMFSKMLGGKK